MAYAATPPEDRIVDKIDTDGDCWHWLGGRQRSSGLLYGRFRVSPTRSDYAHRAIWELFVGPIPAGMTIDHLCRNTLCVNPDHLEVVTQGENTLRGNSGSALNARKTHCKRGHSLEDAYLYGDGRRRCRQCTNARNRLDYWRRKAQHPQPNTQEAA